MSNMHQISPGEAMEMPDDDLNAKITELRQALANHTVRGLAYYSAAVSLRSLEVALEIKEG